jgi:hypothetical protein
LNREEATDKILKWLDSEGWKYSVRDNEPNFDLVCKVDINENSGFIVCIQKIVDRVIIFSKIKFSEEDLSSYKLSVKKYKFWRDLKTYLILMNVNTKIEPNLDELESIELSKWIYFDGLTQDKFVETITKVTDAIELCNIMWTKFVDSIKNQNHQQKEY